MTTQDPELSAALGWPGGISDPVLDRVQLLQMVAALRLASKQALEALEYATPTTDWRYMITALRAALAQQAEPVQEPVACSNTFACQCSKHFASQQSEQRPKRVLTAVWRDRAQRAEAQRYALLEVLKYLDKEFRQHGRQHWPEAVRVRTAIKTVEEGK